MSYTTSELNQINKSRRHILDILHHRGFDTDPWSEFTIDDITSMSGANKSNAQSGMGAFDMLLESRDTSESSDRKKVYVRYQLTGAIRPVVLTDIVDDLFNIDQVLTDSDDLIIITKDDANDTVTSTLTRLWHHDKKFVSIIGIQRLQFNILKLIIQKKIC